MDGLLSCIGRSRKLEKSGSSFLCSRCVNPNVTGVIRCEDFKLMDMVNGGGGQELRECLKELAGKDFVFKIHVTPYNFTPITTPSPFSTPLKGKALTLVPATWVQLEAKNVDTNAPDE
ncbi:hypothetical protein HID58_081688 [Brassica napus]|uniref:Uncharacterized protein n=1 Tax=Brassica napus TaxID=3708 RepID=A0ABQ7YA54_BRANA|nr:hypothetical protein HID58_081688 [Brassica napus]